MKIKIAYIVSTLMRCGPTNQLYNLIKNLDRDRFDPIIITLSPETANSSWPNFENLGIKLHSLGMSCVRGVLSGSPSLRKLLKISKIELIHTQGIRADTVSARYLTDYKRIATLRNYPFSDNTMKYGKIMGYLMSTYHLNTLKKIDKAVSVSNASADSLLSKNNFKIDVIHNGVDTDFFCPPQSYEHKLQLRRELGIPLNKKIFVSAGFLIPLKDPLTIVNAFMQERIKERTHLIFLGDGPLLKESKEKIFPDKHIELRGNVKDTHLYMQSADFFVSASQAEGLPNTVLEAMASGLPPVLSNIEPHKEILNSNLACGKLFKTKDVNGLSNAIHEIICEDYNSKSNSAFDITNNLFSAKIMSRKYQNLYDEILD